MTVNLAFFIVESGFKGYIEAFRAVSVMPGY